jgi:hypothetical protein
MGGDIGLHRVASGPAGLVVLTSHLVEELKQNLDVPARAAFRRIWEQLATTGKISNQERFRFEGRHKFEGIEYALWAAKHDQERIYGGQGTLPNVGTNRVYLFVEYTRKKKDAASADVLKRTARLLHELGMKP